MNYYNEIEPYAADWIESLQVAKEIPVGIIDRRSIVDVQSKDLHGVQQAHFFAGIGGWPLALRLAEWPEDEEVWTGSCPCQPFSVAGKKKGASDKRHLWPIFRDLIEKRRPSTVFGEQVASPAGREWFSGVRADLEKLGYAVGGGDLCAASVSAPQIRQRLFWVASTKSHRHRTSRLEAEPWRRERTARSNGVHVALGVGGPSSTRGWWDGRAIPREEAQGGQKREEAGHIPNQPILTGSMVLRIGRAAALGRIEKCEVVGRGAQRGKAEGREQRPWSDFDALPCRDGAYRRVESGTFPLAHGVPARVGKLRAYGNAIVPQVAAEFVKAYLEVFPT